MSGEAGVPDAWYDAPTFYFSNPYATIGPDDDVPVPPGCSVLDFELEVAAVIGRTGRDLAPARRRGAHRRLHRAQRLVRPRRAGPRDAGGPRPGQGQGHGDHARPLAGDGRRVHAPTPTASCRWPCRRGQRPHGRRGPALQHGLDLRRPRRLRLARHRGAPRRRPRLRAPAATAAASASCGAAASARDELPAAGPGDAVVADRGGHRHPDQPRGARRRAPDPARPGPAAHPPAGRVTAP